MKIVNNALGKVIHRYSDGYWCIYQNLSSTKRYNNNFHSYPLKSNVFHYKFRKIIRSLIYGQSFFASLPSCNNVFCKPELPRFALSTDCVIKSEIYKTVIPNEEYQRNKIVMLRTTLEKTYQTKSRSKLCRKGLEHAIKKNGHNLNIK